MCYGTSQRLSKVSEIQKRIRSGIYFPVFHASYKVVLNQACFWYDADPSALCREPRYLTNDSSFYCCYRIYLWDLQVLWCTLPLQLCNLTAKASPPFLYIHFFLPYTEREMIRSVFVNVNVRYRVIATNLSNMTKGDVLETSASSSTPLLSFLWYGISFWCICITKHHSQHR